MVETMIYQGMRLALAGIPLWMFANEDLRKYRVQDLTLLVLLLGAVAGGFAGFLRTGDWSAPLIGAMAFGLVSAGIREIAYRVTGTESFGPADVVMALCAGAFLGWQALLVYLLLGSVFSTGWWLLISIKRKRKGRRPWRRVPAGPGFATAQIVLMMLEAAGLYAGFPFSLAA